MKIILSPKWFSLSRTELFIIFIHTIMATNTVMLLAKKCYSSRKYCQSN